MKNNEVGDASSSGTVYILIPLHLNKPINAACPKKSISLQIYAPFVNSSS
jgi:hypothetical protein